MKKIKYILLLIFIPLAYLLSCKKNKENETHTVSGIVIDAITKQPVAGVEINGAYQGVTLNNGNNYITTDINGNFQFEFTYPSDIGGPIAFNIRHSNYGGYAGVEMVVIPNQANVSNYEWQIYPNTYINIIITKTDLVDTLINVGYVEPNWIQNELSVNITNTSSPDTLTIEGLAGTNNNIGLLVTRYRTFPTSNTYNGIQSSNGYVISCGSADTTQYRINL